MSFVTDKPGSAHKTTAMDSSKQGVGDCVCRTLTFEVTIKGKLGVIRNSIRNEINKGGKKDMQAPSDLGRTLCIR